ncbi:MAG: hypothetical protein GY920_15940 [Aliivibrio sp.]|nr:hypothetical protein [Aliivibrio sp.]
MKTTFRTVHTNVDATTGEVLQQTTVETLKLPAEPPYIKMYLDDICYLNNLKKSSSDVLNMLLRKLDYDGYITISTRYRQEMLSTLNIKEQTLKNRITELLSSEIIKHSGKNEYKINPYFFGKGNWSDIFNHRQSGEFEIVIKYGKKGKVVKTNILNEQPELKNVI